MRVSQDVGVQIPLWANNNIVAFYYSCLCTMRTLLFHCKNYRVKLGKLADRPKGIVPERVVEKEQHCEDCIVALITVE